MNESRQASFLDLVEQVPPAKAPEIAPIGPAPYPARIAQSILSIRESIGPVPKTGVNKTVGYNYYQAEDVFAKVYKATQEHGLIITQSESVREIFDDEGILAITYEYTIINKYGEVWPDRPLRTGMAWLRDESNNPDDKAATKCSTQSEKYFYVKFFNILTKEDHTLDNDRDRRGAPEADRVDVAPVQQPTVRRPPSAAAMAAKPAQQQTALTVAKPQEPRRPPSAKTFGLGQGAQSKAVQGEKDSLMHVLLGEVEKLSSKKDCAEWMENVIANDRWSTITKEQKGAVTKAWTDQQNKVP
jgi:hypothetical protein